MDRNGTLNPNGRMGRPRELALEPSADDEQSADDKDQAAQLKPVIAPR